MFHAPEVFQERNPHNLLSDFDDEVVGYQQNNLMARVLESLQLKPGVEEVQTNILRCYEALVDTKIMRADELDLLETWLNDLNRVAGD